MCPPATRPGTLAKVSQIEGPRPPWAAAPSIWYAEVAAPHTNPVGNNVSPVMPPPRLLGPIS